MPRKAPRIKFTHGTWYFKRVGAPCLPKGEDGSCDPPEKKGRKWIYVSKSKLKGRKLLETILHEYHHAADPQASEETVEERARVEARLLWRLGWRQDSA